jgi:radical SAM superfamily enzyme YgiQ (UPF0313 family)
MKVLIANAPAYLYDENRHFVHGGTRWCLTYFLPRSEAKEANNKYTPFPYLLGYAVSYLRANSDAEVTFLDACAEDFNEVDFYNYVIKLKPDLLLMEVSTAGYPLVVRLIQQIKELMPELKVAMGGYQLSGYGPQILKNDSVIDFVIIGELELTIAELVNKNLDPTGVQSVMWRNGYTVVTNPIRPVDNEISKYPFPERQEHLIKKYHDFVLKGKPLIYMITSRACPVGCRFCYTTTFYRNPVHRARTPENIAEEMIYVKEKFKAKQIYFDDDTISINPKHLQGLCNYIIQNKIDMPWTAMGDITISQENIRLMKKAGCLGLKFGVESADPDVLKQMHKGTVSAEKALKFRELLAKEEIWSHATFTIGHPKDTHESIKATINFAKKLSPDSLQFAMVTPIPGTPFYNELKTNGYLLTDDLTKYDGGNYSVINMPQLKNNEIEELYKYAWSEWNHHRFTASYAIKSVPLWIKYRGIKETSRRVLEFLS